MRFKVPQNIDIQDRIIGPLTMVQFVYAVVGFGLCYIIFNSIPAPFSYGLIIPIALFVVMLDFVKVNERPFLEFFKSALLFMALPKQRVWHQGEDSDLTIEVYESKKQTGPTIQHKDITSGEMADIAKRYDTGQSLIKS